MTARMRRTDATRGGRGGRLVQAGFGTIHDSRALPGARGQGTWPTDASCSTHPIERTRIPLTNGTVSATQGSGFDYASHSFSLENAPPGIIITLFAVLEQADYDDGDLDSGHIVLKTCHSPTTADWLALTDLSDYPPGSVVTPGLQMIVSTYPPDLRFDLASFSIAGAPSA
jgi:hypothetical protein